MAHDTFESDVVCAFDEATALLQARKAELLASSCAIRTEKTAKLDAQKEVLRSASSNVREVLKKVEGALAEADQFTLLSASQSVAALRQQTVLRPESVAPCTNATLFSSVGDVRALLSQIPLMCLVSPGDDATGMFNLGVRYEAGTGVKQDGTQAVSWFRRAAEAGNTSAMNKLGVCYKKGTEVEKDDPQAVSWFKSAAEANNALAMNNLGLCYSNGIGVEQDVKQAVSWYRRAAAAGNAKAMNNLGCSFFNGHGVEKDATHAISWFRRAADAGNTTAMRYLGECYEDGTGVEKDATQAVSWFKRAAEAGDAEALNKLAECKKGMGSRSTSRRQPRGSGGFKNSAGVQH
eukprot:TRINITY_DN2551_c0_g1_i5.p1 TRINITY_DN2551_c0_g1~~TRINITY_DN2551_c0_g1_i5.p1  ORF type:complete len:349 (-),score=87.97 TRINITY_DN2551_c0_g1_i5:51-1097(-)